MKEFMKRAAAFFAAVVMVASLSTGALAAPDATQRPRSSANTSQSSSSSDSSSSKSTDDSSSSDNDSDSSSSSSRSSSSDSSSSRSSSDDDGDSSSDNSSGSTSKSGTAKKVEEQPSQTQPPTVTQAPAASAANKSYTTKGGAFLWFLLSVIVNTAISFAIAKRFYKLAKQSNRVQAEIRALRHDIEEKFADSVDGFAEPAVDITNTNDDYSFSPDGIKMTPASTTDGAAEDTEATYKEWEAQFGARHRQRREAVEAQQPKQADYAEMDDIEEESTSYDEEEPRRSPKKYQPSRGIQRTSSAKKSGRKLSSRNVDEDEEKGNISGKVKGLVGKLFPMDDDE